MVQKPYGLEAFLDRSLYGTEAFLVRSFFAGFFGCGEAVSLCWGIRSEASFANFHVGGNLDALYSWWTVRTTARALACNSRPKWPIVLHSCLAGKAESG